MKPAGPTRDLVNEYRGNGLRITVDRRDDERSQSRETDRRGPMIRSAGSAGLVQCANCTAGFRRVDGVHIGSQRLGMIPNTPCERVFATHGGNMTENNNRPWMAYVDGEPIRKKSGDARRFAAADKAYAAACKAAPRRWHP